jgi:hypothetical protein
MRTGITRAAAGISSPSTALLDALRDWRWAEVNHAAIVLGMRVGDEQDARRASELALNNLRIAADKALSPNAQHHAEAGRPIA